VKQKPLINIDFKKFRTSFREYVRSKAIEAGSTIVYVMDNKLVEEDPKSEKITILKESFLTR